MSVFCILKTSHNAKCHAFYIQMPILKISWKMRNVKCLASCTRCLVFLKCLAFFILKRIAICFAFCIYINVHVVFANGSHCDLNLYTKTSFLQFFLNIHKKQKTQSFLRKEYIYIWSQILRALLSNKNGILNFWKNPIIQ